MTKVRVNWRDCPIIFADDERFQGVLRRALGLVSEDQFDARSVATIMYSLAKLHQTRKLNANRSPALIELWDALDSGAIRVASEMNSQEVANTVWGYATLGRQPGDETWRALETSAKRVAPEMNSQNVANTVWGYATLSTLQGTEMSSSSTLLWEMAREMKVEDISDQSLQMLFHTQLMIKDFMITVDGSHNNELDPLWLTVDARSAWMQSTRDEVSVSQSQKALARIIGELGFRYKMEHLSSDNYFSFDIYLPDHDVAVEFDGPFHFLHASDRARDKNTVLTKNGSTKLRDLFLAKRCSRLLTVPYFEWQNLNTSEMRRNYVREKLEKEGGINVMTTAADVATEVGEQLSMPEHPEEKENVKKKDDEAPLDVNDKVGVISGIHVNKFGVIVKRTAKKFNLTLEGGKSTSLNHGAVVRRS